MVVVHSSLGETVSVDGEVLDPVAENRAFEDTIGARGLQVEVEPIDGRWRMVFIEKARPVDDVWPPRK